MILDQGNYERTEGVDWAEILISSTVNVSMGSQMENDDKGVGIGINIARSANEKCGRCWRLLPEVAEDGDLCDRCEGVVNG